MFNVYIPHTYHIIIINIVICLFGHCVTNFVVVIKQALVINLTVFFVFFFLNMPHFQ